MRVTQGESTASTAVEGTEKTQQQMKPTLRNGNRLPGEKFLGQDAHQPHVVPAAAVGVSPAQPPLLLEAAPGVGADARLVELVHPQPDAVEVQLPEAVLQSESGGLGAVALPPELGRADENAELGGAGES